jgi:hypothetical protein
VFHTFAERRGMKRGAHHKEIAGNAPMISFSERSGQDPHHTSRIPSVHKAPMKTACGSPFTLADAMQLR